MMPMTYTMKMCTSVASQLSDYPIVILSFLHVQSNGELLLNFESISSTPDPCIYPGIQQLIANNQLPFLSIGGTNSGVAPGDYSNILNNYDTFWSNLKGVLQTYNFAGVDLDLETTYEPYLDILVTLVNDLSAAGYLVIAPPYESMGFWQQLATQSGFPGGYPKIFAYNIQTYANTGVPPATQVRSWVDGFSKITPVPQEFIGSGYLSGTNTPAQITDTLNTVLQSEPSSFLAFMWRFPTYATGFDAADYAAAVEAAAGPQPDVKARVKAHYDRLATLKGKTA